MQQQLTAGEQALRLFFTDDVYLVAEAEPVHTAQVKAEKPAVPAQTVQPVAEPAPAVYKFLGSNKRNILILVNDAEHEVSDEKGRELLRKIVKSVNLTAADFALLNYAAYQNTSLEQFRHHFSCAFVFAFGVSPQHLGITDHPQNSVVSSGDIKLIFAMELRRLDEDQQAKKALWSSLKQMGL